MRIASRTMIDVERSIERSIERTIERTNEQINEQTYEPPAGAAQGIYPEELTKALEEAEERVRLIVLEELRYMGVLWGMYMDRTCPVLPPELAPFPYNPGTFSDSLLGGCGGGTDT